MAESYLHQCIALHTVREQPLGGSGCAHLHDKEISQRLSHKKETQHTLREQKRTHLAFQYIE